MDGDEKMTDTVQGIVESSMCGASVITLSSGVGGKGVVIVR